ncbi:class I SAM-dependent methyltransferase [Phycicoccus avicenniae]|uniref:class I SAM-dependent methyltransferase n=1 Tax=Phycicoccus avicenniae TaxID=2828860 RepID=UPI003D26588A
MSTHDAGHAAGHDHQHGSGTPLRHEHGYALRDDESVWDARYSETDRIWSGEPNHGLTVEAAALVPGRALDVGCGEGADAVWLATRGWSVTAIDPSGVALERARRAAGERRVEVTWLRGGLGEVELPDAGFDLVSVFYPAISLDIDPVAQLAALVAPGGTLLVVHHADVDRERAIAHGFDPDTLLAPKDVAAGLREADGWEVLEERRPRLISGGAGAHHADDLVVRATRTA